MASIRTVISDHLYNIQYIIPGTLFLMLHIFLNQTNKIKMINFCQEWQLMTLAIFYWSRFGPSESACKIRSHLFFKFLWTYMYMPDKLKMFIKFSNPSRKTVQNGPFFKNVRNPILRDEGFVNYLSQFILHVYI